MNIHSTGQEEDEQTPAIIHYPANDYLLKVVRNYFRSDPYSNSFGFFVKHLMDDPLLTSKTIQLKTDSAFFYFHGAYKNFRPFDFVPDRTEIKLAEKEFSDDSLHTKDTVFVYQLLGYSDKGKPGLDSIKNEFSKFNRHYGKHFIVEAYDIKKGSVIVGGRRDYYVNGKGSVIIGGRQDYYVYGINDSPLSIAWSKIDDLQSVFMITLFLKKQ